MKLFISFLQFISIACIVLSLAILLCTNDAPKLQNYGNIFSHSINLVTLHILKKMV